MGESFFPIGFFAEAFFAPQYFVEPISSPVPIVPVAGPAGGGAGGGKGKKQRYVIEKSETLCVYNEQQDEAELFTILLAFLKTMEDNRK